MSQPNTDYIELYDPRTYDNVSTPPEEAAATARQIQILLIKGRYDNARRLISALEWKAALNTKLNLEQLLDFPLAGSTLIPRITNTLETHGILTVRQLLAKKQPELEALQGIGIQYTIEIIKFLNQILRDNE